MWLAVQLWVELLIAAGLGGLIGWALHMRLRPQPAGEVVRPVVAPTADTVADPQGRVKVAELEAKLRAEKDEVADLRRKLVASEKKSADAAADEEGSLAWRNRYLESRIRFLEGKVADLEHAAAPDQAPDDDNNESTRLRWRNRYLDGRVKYLEEELERNGGLVPAQVASTPVAQPAPGGSQIKVSAAMLAPDAAKPESLEAPRNGSADDLKRITGIGPKIEKMLNGLGIWHYDQIAAWTQQEIDWVNTEMSFRGRIERDNWVRQAGELTKK
jgi:predicted flap endonuclease-1-like 5' DNA nuclease